MSRAGSVARWASVVGTTPVDRSSTAAHARVAGVGDPSRPRDPRPRGRCARRPEDVDHEPPRVVVATLYEVDRASVMDSASMTDHLSVSARTARYISFAWRVWGKRCDRAALHVSPRSVPCGLAARFGHDVGNRAVVRCTVAAHRCRTDAAGRGCCIAGSGRLAPAPRARLAPEGAGHAQVAPPASGGRRVGALGPAALSDLPARRDPHVTTSGSRAADMSTFRQR